MIVQSHMTYIQSFHGLAESADSYNDDIIYICKFSIAY